MLKYAQNYLSVTQMIYTQHKFIILEADEVCSPDCGNTSSLSPKHCADPTHKARSLFLYSEHKLLTVSAEARERERERERERKKEVGGRDSSLLLPQTVNKEPLFESTAASPCLALPYSRSSNPLHPLSPLSASLPPSHAHVSPALYSSAPPRHPSPKQQALAEKWAEGGWMWEREDALFNSLGGAKNSHGEERVAMVGGGRGAKYRKVVSLSDTPLVIYPPSVAGVSVRAVRGPVCGVCRRA